MKTKNTLFLLIVAGAIFAFIYFVENKMPTSQKAAERAGKVVEFNRDKITSITIKNTDTQIDLHKDKDGVWTMDKPVKDRADSMAITQLFTDSEALKSDAIVGDSKKGADKDQVKEFGLGSPETKLTFIGDEKPVTILFGKDAAIEGKLYVRLDGSNVVHVIGNNLKTQVTKKVDDFRDHKLTELTSTKVDKLTFKTGAGEIEVDKKDQHWSLSRPLKARGNDQKIGDVISQIANAKVESFAADSSNLSAFGLQEPRATFTLHSDGDDKPVTLDIGQAVDKEKDKDKIYVKLSTRESVLVVPKSVGDIADTKPNDLRDRNLVRVETDIVDRMTLETPGKEKIVLARKGEKWVRKDNDKEVSINSAAAKRLLDEIKSEQVVDFVSDLATELPKYGLDQPKVKITLSSYASENTAETKAGEKPIVSVFLGNSPDGQNVYAKLDDEPFVVSVSKSILDAAMTDPLQWQELAIYKNKSDDIVSVEITRQGQAAIAIERNKDKKWAFTKGDGKINEINAESLVNTLANLKAVRWAGANAPEFGLDKPSLTVTFKTASNAAGKLTLGAKTSDEITYATAEGFTGVFVLSRPDVSAFELPLQAGVPAPIQSGSIDGSPAIPTPPLPIPAPPATTPPATTPAPPATTPAPTTDPATPTPPVPMPAPATPAPAPATPAPPATTPSTPTPLAPAPSTTPPAAPSPAPVAPPASPSTTPPPASEAPATTPPAPPVPTPPAPAAPAPTAPPASDAAPAAPSAPVPSAPAPPSPTTAPAPAPSSPPPSADAVPTSPNPAPASSQPADPSSKPEQPAK